MNTKYILDGNDFEVKPQGRLWPVVRTVISVLLLSIAFTIVAYLLLALVFSTRTERVLRKEIRQYASEYKFLEQKEELLRAEITGLELQNDDLYNTIFNTPAPRARDMNTFKYSIRDTTRDENIITNSALRLEDLAHSAAVTEDNFTYVLKKVTATDFVMPPMNLPLKNFSYARVGASVGEKQSPIFRVVFHHTGMDIFSESGEPVLATAAGYVSEVTRSVSGLGNTVTITHEGGYVTKYGHLADISVRTGAYVKKGARIAATGVSGQTMAPCLHYEVWKDGNICDPVHYFYYNLNPEEYANCLIVGSSTGQSLD